MSDTQSFPNIDTSRWQAIRDSAHVKAGITISADSGEAEEKGVAISWAYDPSSETLEVTLVKRSWYDPSAKDIDADIKAWIEST